VVKSIFNNNQLKAQVWSMNKSPVVYVEQEEHRSSGVQEFRSSGVQENPEREDLPGDTSDHREQGLQSLTSFLSHSQERGGVRITISFLSF
jgi:hypothetical protein